MRTHATGRKSRQCLLRAFARTFGQVRAANATLLLLPGLAPEASSSSRSPRIRFSSWVPLWPQSYLMAEYEPQPRPGRLWEHLAMVGCSKSSNNPPFLVSRLSICASIDGREVGSFNNWEGIAGRRQVLWWPARGSIHTRNARLLPNHTIKTQGQRHDRWQQVIPSLTTPYSKHNRQQSGHGSNDSFSSGIAPPPPNTVAGSIESVLSVDLAHPNIVQTFKSTSRAMLGPPSADRTGATGSFATQPREGSQPSGKFTETWLVLEFCDRDCLQEAIDRGMFCKSEDSFGRAQPHLPYIR
ncbi:hypothetical protein WJX84_007050 [Apatococcus fuscideae]|uniref:Uncharacterized protein n=1 Tax=Apatococcus fuscideae TaxID=2026836 RepID=A0AAW1T3M9_9CHLO